MGVSETLGYLILGSLEYGSYYLGYLHVSGLFKTPRAVKLQVAQQTELAGEILQWVGHLSYFKGQGT